MRTVTLSSALVASMLLGCTDTELAGGPEPSCSNPDPQRISLDEPTELGITGAEMLDRARGPHTPGFEWLSGETTALTIEVLEHDDGAWLLDTEEDSCGEPAVFVDAALAFTTDDGLFDERWDVQLVAHTFDHDVKVSVVFDEAAGAFDPAAFAPEGEQAAPTVLSIAFDPDDGACGIVQGHPNYPESPAGFYEIGWFWTEPAVDDGGTGRDHMIGCMFAADL